MRIRCFFNNYQTKYSCVSCYYPNKSPDYYDEKIHKKRDLKNIANFQHNGMHALLSKMERRPYNKQALDNCKKFSVHPIDSSFKTFGWEVIMIPRFLMTCQITSLIYCMCMPVGSLKTVCSGY